MATYNAVSEWARKADAEKTQNELMFNAIFPPARERLQSEMTMLGDTAANSVKSGWQMALEQHSPSRVLLGLGRQAAESLVDGVNDGMDNSSSGAGGGRVAVGEINITVMTMAGDPDALRQAIRAPLIAEVRDSFEKLRREGKPPAQEPFRRPVARHPSARSPGWRTRLWEPPGPHGACAGPDRYARPCSARMARSLPFASTSTQPKPDSDGWT